MWGWTGSHTHQEADYRAQHPERERRCSGRHHSISSAFQPAPGDNAKAHSRCFRAIKHLRRDLRTNTGLIDVILTAVQMDAPGVAEGGANLDIFTFTTLPPPEWNTYPCMVSCS